MILKVIKHNVGLGFHAESYNGIKDVYEIPKDDAVQLIGMGVAIPYVEEEDDPIDDFTRITGIGEVTERKIRENFKNCNSFYDLITAIETYPDRFHEVVGKSKEVIDEWLEEAKELDSSSHD